MIRLRSGNTDQNMDSFSTGAMMDMLVSKASSCCWHTWVLLHFFEFPVNCSDCSGSDSNVNWGFHVFLQCFPSVFPVFPQRCLLKSAVVVRAPGWCQTPGCDLRNRTQGAWSRRVSLLVACYTTSLGRSTLVFAIEHSYHML